MLHLGLSALMWWGQSREGHEAEADEIPGFTQFFLDPGFALGVFLLTFAVIGMASLYKLVTLRTGGAGVAMAMGGREVMPVTRDLRERRLLNVVEEMALAAGVSMPRVFILDNESGMNAFAAGFSSKDAAVAVTRGLLVTLNRDELQAVIGHEFSHILNGDMRLNIRLIAVLHGIFAITILGMIIIRLGGRIAASSNSSSSKKNNSAGAALAVMALGGICWLVGQVGFFFGRLIQSSISRQREFLADASAVQFTRNPDGLASALKLIGAGSGGLKSPKVSAVSHMLFASGLNSMFATHPPLLARIRKMEPDFDGDLMKSLDELTHRTNEAIISKPQETEMDAEDEQVVRNTLYGVRHALHYEEGAARSTKAQGAPQSKPLLDLSWLSDEDRNMLHDPLSAQCCVCGALLSADTALRDQQLAMLPYRFNNDTEMRDASLAWQERMRDWTMRQRRIACELAVATLRSVPPGKLATFCASIDKLCRADNVMEPFEFALTCMIRRRLQTDSTLAQARKSVVAPSAPVSEIAHVLSMVATFEPVSEQAAHDAWSVGKQRLLPYTGEMVLLDASAVRDFDAFDAALTKLERLSPLFKRELMMACQAIAEYDGVITDTEENLIFAIADAIDAIGWNAAVKAA